MTLARFLTLILSRNIYILENKEQLKAIYVTFGAAIFSALEIDSEQANCDAAKTDYINFISGLGRFSNWSLEIMP